MAKKPVSYFMVGTVLGMISIVLFLAYYFTGLAYDTSWIKYIPVLICIGLLIYFVVQYSNANNNNVTFGGLFGYGFRSSVIWTLIMIVFMLLVLFAIFPDYKEKAMELGAAELDKQSSLSEQQKDVALKFTDKFFTSIALASTIFLYIVSGIIAALLGAAIAKKNPVSPFNQTV